MWKLLLVIPAIALTVAACSGGDDGRESATETGSGEPQTEGLAGVDLSAHSVSLEEIYFDTFDGGSIPLSDISEERYLSLRDAIPPLNSPKYDDASGGDWMERGDLVLGYESEDGGAWAYPFKVLNFHEIVNDELDGVPVLVTYCPLCRSGVVYDRRLDDMLLSFGNTSALYESDLVMYDHQTNSFWWQTAGEAIVGTLTGTRLETLPAVTSTWARWKEAHPDTLVLSRDTGFARPYERDPFAGYASSVNSGNFPFPVSESAQDDRLLPADQVLGVTVGDESVAYPLLVLGDAAVNDSVDDAPVVVFSSADGPSGAAFRPEAGGQRLTFRHEDGAYVDSETGSEWDLSGRAVAGPLEDKELEPLPSRYTFWFAYVAAFPDARVFQP